MRIRVDFRVLDGNNIFVRDIEMNGPTLTVIVGRTTKNDLNFLNDVPSIFILDVSILVRLIDGSQLHHKALLGLDDYISLHNGVS